VEEILKTQSAITKTRKILIIIDILLLISTLAFIWGNSLESAAESMQKSTGILTSVTPVLELFLGAGRVTDHIVRKIAHFAEFFLLGCEVMLLGIFLRRVRTQQVVNCLSVSLAAAVTDESLQLLSDRGAQISDVLLDFCGAACGILLLLLIYALTRIRKRRKK